MRLNDRSFVGLLKAVLFAIGVSALLAGYGTIDRVSAQQPMSLTTHGNGAEAVICDSSVAVTITSATTTALVALAAGKTVYVCNVSLHLVGNATAVLATFEYGTGAACSTPTVLSGPYTGSTTPGTTTPVNIGSNIGYVFKAATSNALCIVSVGTAGINGVVSYTQF